MTEPGGDVEWRARLPDERVEVCGAGDRSAALARRFDGSNYDN